MLEMLAKAAAASQFPGFSRWVSAAQHEHHASAPVQPRPAQYQPQFYTPAEYRAIDILTELIIPRDETSGAHEAGVSEFIDFMAAHGEDELRQPMRDGLAWLEAQSKKMHAASFVNLSAEAQTTLLESVAYRNGHLQQDVQGQAFFQLIRRYTVMGFYTSRIGLEELDFPGLRLYAASPACPHKDDPEHRHLSLARPRNA